MNNRKRKKLASLVPDLKYSDNSFINIKDLPKEQVLVALFRNVYKKSEASRQAWITLVDLYYPDPDKRAPIGTYDLLTRYEAEDILNNALLNKKKLIM